MHEVFRIVLSFVSMGFFLSPQLNNVRRHWSYNKILTVMRLHEVIWPTKYILTVFGLWPMHPNTTLASRLFAHLRFVMGLLTLINVVVPEVTTVVIHWGNLGILADNGSLAIFHVLLILKLLYIKCRRQSFSSMYQHLKYFWRIGEDPQERRIYERWAHLAKLVTIGYWLAGMSNLMGFEVVAFIGWMANRRVVNDSMLHRPLVLELDYGFDTQQTPIYEIVFISQSICGVSTVSAVTGFDCTIIVFIVHVSAQFKLIASRFRAIGRKISEQLVAKDELRAKIGKLVAQHNHTIRVTEELSALLRPVMFVQMLISGFDICLVGYAVIESDSGAVQIFKFFVFLATLLMQLILWCAPAELLIRESTAIAETIYCEVPWFKLTPSQRRDLGFVMMRAQKECRVMGLYQAMSIRRITDVVNTACSYMALLRSMKK